ncbi:ABC transporter ATP-binding protein [Yinghuangia sp. YIM S09857]|uniref:ABC transporter ATP-binding protein n=1 Tax=Yinghuangia sp. YIM S09857 TaxID=3436929 RepID=UPI003F53912E
MTREAAIDVATDADTGTTDEPLLSVTELRVRIADRCLVDGVSFDLRAGRILALVGPSGSGKTTTAAAVLGEYPARSTVDGRVVVAGHRAATGDPLPPGTAAYVPQHPAAALAPALRTGPVLHEIARRHLPGPQTSRGERRLLVREAVTTALRNAGLPQDGSLHRRFPHQLSGGQQQRLVIAHALLARARLLVADEPTTGLDAVLRHDVADRLRALADTGIGVLLLSHDLDVVRRISDDVLVLHQGRQVEYGPTDEVFGRPSAPLTRALIAADHESADPTPDREPPATPTGPTTPEPGLAVTNLSAWYGGPRRTTALTDVELRLTPGTCLAVVGPSGSGKTTLARCLVGLHRHWHGTVRLHGSPLAPSATRRRRDELAGIQYVFQDARASLDPRRSVLDQVARPAVRLRGADPRTAREQAVGILAAMGVDEPTAVRRPQALSGGELRRAVLARALAADPDILICDEITAGLDPLARTAVLDLLAAQLRDRGVALLLITHERPVAARLADHIAVIDSGHVIDRGPAPDLLNHPHHPLTKALLADTSPPETLNNVAATLPTPS